MKITNGEKRVINYLYSTCMFGGGQNIYFIEECGLDDEYETNKVSKIMQGLKRKGLVNYVSCTRVWYLTKEGKEMGKFTIGNGD